MYMIYTYIYIYIYIHTQARKYKVVTDTWVLLCQSAKMQDAAKSGGMCAPASHHADQKRVPGYNKKACCIVM